MFLKKWYTWTFPYTPLIKYKKYKESLLYQEWVNHSLNLIIQGLDEFDKEDNLEIVRTKFQAILEVNSNKMLEAQRVGKK